MAHATRTPRPHRVVTFVDFDATTVVDAEGNENFVYEVVEIGEFVQEYGRRAGLHTNKSAIRDRQRTFNRKDRHEARLQLRRDPESVELRQARGRALWSAV